LASLVAVALVAGCAARGTTVEMFVRTADDRQMRYMVDHRNTFHFAGGWYAIDGTYTWTHPLTPEQIAELSTLIRAAGWLEEAPRSPKGAEGDEYDVKYSGPDGRVQFKFVGQSPALDDVYRFLDGIAMTRLETDMQRLPKPSREELDEP
jgi:hypothetical protein